MPIPSFRNVSLRQSLANDNAGHRISLLNNAPQTRSLGRYRKPIAVLDHNTAKKRYATNGFGNECSGRPYRHVRNATPPADKPANAKRSRSRDADHCRGPKFSNRARHPNPTQVPTSRRRTREKNLKKKKTETTT